MLQASKSKKSFKDSRIVNREMNDKTYALRREVINLLYEIKELVPSLPRIDVRICDAVPAHQTLLGLGQMKGCTIWICTRTITESRINLRGVVYHEVLHAVYGVDHDEKCPLMKAIHAPELTKAQIHKLFMKWVKKSTKGKV